MRVADLLEGIRLHCRKKNITIPKSILEVGNEQAVNEYVRNEVERSAGKLESNKYKMRMFQTAHSILSSSSLFEEKPEEI